ncbi:MAG: hypothetical protein JWM59_2858 [Verrucomicrobiales bacterium]|nr:hypothetical protein [Verrucomicrobiales bacterium]
MKFSASILLLSAFWLGSPTAASAGEEAPAYTEPPLSDLMQPYDVDNDGKLSVEERQAYADVMKQAAKQPEAAQGLPWDTDGDGVLAPEELQAAAEAIKQKIEAERSARFDELDRDEDGRLSATEFMGVPNLKPKVVARMLNHVDTDHDGFISKAEFMAALDSAAPKITKAPASGTSQPSPVATPAPPSSPTVGPVPTPASGPSPTVAPFTTTAPALIPAVPTLVKPSKPGLLAPNAPVKPG